MNSETTLSIIIVTMNRREQLLAALESCRQSKLPDCTEFIIIDNASTDGTGSVVEKYFAAQNRYFYQYKCLSENRGAGSGRNEGFKLAKGKYLYFLDDDGVIDNACKDIFFIKSIELMDHNRDIATLTTRVWDEALQDDRKVVVSSKNRINGYPTICTIHGGSSFFRTSVFEAPLYPGFRYGAEEFMPSFYTLDKGLYNLYVPEIVMIHKPRINKWADGSLSRRDVISKYNAGIFAVKYLMYPAIFRPLLLVAFIVRWYVHLRKFNGALKTSYAIFKERTRGATFRKIKFGTVVRIFKEFGVGAGV